MGQVQEVVSLEPSLLPDWIRDFARDFPELCQPAASLPGDPLGSVVGGGEGLEVIQAALASLKVGDAPASKIVEYRPNGRCAPSLEVAALARRLTVRWLTSKTATISIAAPGKLNRLSALRGEPVPYYAQLQRSAPGKQDALQALLAVDWSGSMSGPKWLAARAAAQSITLALRANSGEVHALLFADDAWHAPDFSADVLFHDRLGYIDLTNADGEDTSFRWLPRVWERFPTHRVLVLTDGNGYLPNLVLPSWRKRTSAILLMVRDEAGSHTEYVEQIEITVSTFANQFVHVSSLDELASAWAYLIPRRWNA